MDYTLAEYISPEFDQLGCVLAQQHLVTARGYSPAILDIQYDPAFPVRGLWYDKLKGNGLDNRLSTSSNSFALFAGNLLKVDQLGCVLVGFHGFQQLDPGEVAAEYPGRLQPASDRVFVMNTLFNLAETFLLAALVDWLDSNQDWEATSSGWRRNKQEQQELKEEPLELSFIDLFSDIRAAIDHIHLAGPQPELKRRLLAEPDRWAQSLAVGWSGLYPYCCAGT